MLLADTEALEPLEGAIPDGVKIIPKEALWTLAERATPDPTPYPTRPNDPAILIYTSGTTGKPKELCYLMEPWLATYLVSTFSPTFPVAPPSTGPQPTGPGWEVSWTFFFPLYTMASQ